MSSNDQTDLENPASYDSSLAIVNRNNRFDQHHLILAQDLVQQMYVVECPSHALVLQPQAASTQGAVQV